MGLASDGMQFQQQPAGAGGAVTGAEVEDRLAGFLGVADQAARRSGGGGAAECVARGLAGGVEITRLASGAKKPQQEIADAGAAMSEVGRREGERHVAHHPPAQAVRIGLGHLQQPLAHGDGVIQRGGMQALFMGVEQDQARARGAHRLVVDLAVAFQAGDVGKRHGFNPADAGPQGRGLAVQPVHAGRRRGAEVVPAAGAGQFVEREGIAGPTGGGAHRQPVLARQISLDLLARRDSLGQGVRILPDRMQFQQHQDDATGAVIEAVV